MKYFFDTTETIPLDLGFGAYSAVHIIWLTVLVAVCIGCSILYAKSGDHKRAFLRKLVAIALLVDEILLKQLPLIIGGRWLPDYLPLHLCSINIFLVVWHAWKGGDAIGGFLYTVCIPGALAAMLFPTWACLPAVNLMVIHSFTVHILLILYPVMLISGKDIRPNWRHTPKYMIILACMAVLAFVVNLLLDTNFFFLMQADPGNPLYFFETAWGSHLLGFPVIIVGVLLVMQGPFALLELKKKTK